MSAPPLMLGALVVGARRGRDDVVGVLAAAFILGILGEPDTWEALRRPRSDPLSTACVASEVTLPTLLLADVLMTAGRAQLAGAPQTRTSRP